MMTLRPFRDNIVISDTFDPYVPIRIGVEYQGAGRHLYWRACPNDSMLLEIGVDETTGELCSLSLTAISPESVHVRDPHCPEPQPSVVHGIPVFALDRWNAGSDYSSMLFDETVEVHLEVGSTSCRVQVGDRGPVATSIRCGQVDFGFTANGTLARIQVSGPSPSSIKHLLELAV